MLATTLGLVLLAPPELKNEGTAGTVAVTGLTDSQVASAVVTRGMTTTFPLCAIAMELSAQLEARGAELFLEWIPRGSNKEADALADGRFEGFDENLRVQAEVSKVRWFVLGGLLRAGAAFQKEAAALAGRRGGTGTGALRGPCRKVRKLQEREPW